MDSLDEIKSKIDIVSLLSDYIKLTRAGRNWKALCPFHKERTPSFVVSPELQIWRCFGACAEGGDIFKFVMKIENVDFGEAVRLLAKRVGVTLTPRFGPKSSEKEELYRVNAAAAAFYHYLLTRHPIGKAALAYFKQERGLQDETIVRFELGFAPAKDALTAFLVKKRGYPPERLVQSGLVVEADHKIIDRFRGRIVFPLRDHRGNTLGFSGRILPQDEKKDIAKYVNTPETVIYHKRQHLFGLDKTHDYIKQEGYAILVEGEFDLLSAWQADVRNIAAIKGSVFTEEQARLLSRFCQEVVFALDSDAAGQQATKQGIMTALQYFTTVRVASLGAFKDPDEAVRTDPKAFKKKISTAFHAYDFFVEQALSRYKNITTAEVAAISRELVPIVAAIPDRIVQAHYIKVIADRLKIAESAVVSQVETTTEKREVKLKVQESGKPFKFRKELLEERLVSLVLQSYPEFLVQKEIEQLITSPVLVRVSEELKKFLAGGGKFNAKHFVGRLPAELIDTVTSMLLAPVEFNSSQVHRELDVICQEIRALELSETIGQITQKIKIQEQKGKDSKREQEELARLVTKLYQVKL